MSHSTETGKWDSIYREETHGAPHAAAVLVDNLHLLPARGKALDAASGLGANALLLAESGLQTHAWDISGVALKRLAQSALERGLTVQTEQRNIVENPPEPESFDVIVVSRFLDRKLTPHLINALRSDGLIFYQTFIKDKQAGIGPGNPDYLLNRNELLHLFQPLNIVLYREEGIIGDIKAGFRNEAMLIAQRQRLIST